MSSSVALKQHQRRASAIYGAREKRGGGTGAF